MDGRGAVEMVCMHPPNYYSVIVLDIQMPYKNGIEACREIQEFFDKFTSNFSPVSQMSTPRGQPFIYALTSEVEDEMIRRMRAEKFKAIYHFLDQEALKEMLENAGLEYQLPKPETDIESINFNPELYDLDSPQQFPVLDVYYS